TAITYLLPGVVSALRRQHPGLRFFVREAGSSAVADAVLRGELDLGIVTLPVRVPGRGDLQEIPLVDDEMRLIVPAGHALEGRRGFRFRDVASEAFVAFEAGSAVRELVDRAAERAGATLSVVMELRSIESIKHMVAASIGIGLVSRFALGDREGLRCRDDRLVRQLAIVRRADRVPAPGPAEFERMLVQANA
ncbi:MAG: LysR family transcriptional regulator substrate-binding protein, partial [Phycisphaerales bacterium]|nr:LysR family transcriptional regulator substrate-binding protein [Phycisphaerales bacterium]